MKKKRIIAWSVVVGVILTLCIICAMVFTLNEIDFQLTAQISVPERSRLFSQTNTTQVVEENMYNSAKFNKGDNLLFMNFDKQIENIEKANPYVKIDKIVRRFPNKITVYYSEREPVALVKVADVDNAYFVIDNTLKVLDYVKFTADEYVSVQNNSKYVLPVLNYYNQTFNVAVGETLNNQSLKENLSTFVAGAFSANGSVNALYEDIFMLSTNIKFYNENEDNRCEYVLKANSNANVIFEVWNINERFLDKITYSWDVFIEKYKETSLTNDLTLKVYIHGGKISIVDLATNTEILLDN